jgi:hypothetical protein
VEQMSKTSLKLLLAFSVLLSALTSWQLANEYEFQYYMNETPEAMQAYSSYLSLTYVFLTVTFFTLIWAAVSAYFKE